MSRVLSAVASHAALQPNSQAIRGQDIALSYADLAKALDSAKTWLEAELANVPRDAPVAIALDNGPAWVVLDLALIGLRRPCLPLPQFFNAEQRAHALADCGAAAILRAAQPGEATGVRLGGTAVVAQPLTAPSRQLHVGAAKITYTSGSTGRPKGVCLSLAQMENVAASVVTALGATYAGAHMPVLPLGVLLENVAGLYAVMLAGGAYFAPPLRALGYGQDFKPDIKQLADLVEAQAITSLIMPPELLRGLTQLLVATGRRLPSLRFVAVGGAKVAPQLVEAARDVGLPAHEGYGLTECASVVSLNTPTADRSGAVGRPLAHVDLRVAADGELIIGNAPFLGYVGEAAQVGAFATGDIGRIDPQGFVAISGRKSNMLITAMGRNVAPEWVESELAAQPEIAQSVVFGEGADELCALLVPSGTGLGETAVAQAVARANAALPPYARIGRWRVAAPFDPTRGELTANGRPRREALAAAHREFIDFQP